MAGRILVTYGTWTGSTAEVAEAVADEIRQGGAAVDVAPAAEVHDVAAYDTIVLGTPVRASRLHRDVTAFVKRHAEGLSAAKVALFVSCLTMKEDTEENRQKSLEFLEPILKRLPRVSRDDVGLFAGAVFSDEERVRKLPLRERLVLKMLSSQKGDYRNWDAIRAWARKVSGGSS
ncbi:MAG: flavodoxin domain-containing protein [Candidatus Eisenbacteria bacterium]|nr:flavodoxin domain-containing protein [Candidatus Eisenbacteria bacterium]